MAIRLVEFYPLLRDGALAVSLTVIRTTAMLAVTPFLGKGTLPGLARNGLILVASLPALPLVYAARPAEPSQLGVLTLAALAGKEALIGLLLGLPLAAAVWGLEAAGFLIDNQRGSTMAQSLDPATESQTSPLGILLAQLFTVWLLVSGHFTVLLDALYQSHRLWPVWSFLPEIGPQLVPAALGLLDTIMRLAVVLAAPALLIMILAELGLALMGKFTPQLQVFFVAMPLKSGLAFLMLTLALPVIVAVVAAEVPDAPALLAWVRALVGPP